MNHVFSVKFLSNNPNLLNCIGYSQTNKYKTCGRNWEHSDLYTANSMLIRYQ